MLVTKMGFPDCKVEYTYVDVRGLNMAQHSDESCGPTSDRSLCADRKCEAWISSIVTGFFAFLLTAAAVIWHLAILIPALIMALLFYKSCCEYYVYADKIQKYKNEDKIRNRG